MLKLRDYQQTAVNSVLEDWKTNDAVLITCATGGGKTAIFLSILDRVTTPGKRALVLAHRQELIFQPRDRMYDYYPHWQGKIGVVMGEYNEVDQPITIATVQTLYSEKRLDALLAHGTIDYLVYDEVHHSPSDCNYELVKRLRESNPNMKTVGVTATPIRVDGDGLSKIFEKESCHYGIVELIKQGWLVPVRWLGIQVGISLQSVKVVAGDYQKKALANAYEVDNCFDLVVESHQKYASDRQALAFTVSVDGAYRLAERFNDAGIKAIAADANTDRKERRRILDAFMKREYQVLVNMGLFTEGLDIPEVSCIHQVRPTKSDGLYVQIIGRALRKFPGKEDALILDYCPIETRNVVMAGDVLGTPIRKEAYIEEKEAGEVVGGFTFDGKYEWMDGNPADIIAKQLDYLDMSPWSWYRGDDGIMTISLGEASDGFDRTLVVTQPVEGEVVLFGIGKKKDAFPKVTEIERGEVDSILDRAEEIANKYGNAVLIDKKKRWRKEPASEAQIKFAKRLKGAYRPGLSKGAQAERITHALAVKEIDKLWQKNSQ